MLKQSKQIDRKVISVSLTLPNHLVLPRSRPEWVSACKKKKIILLYHQANLYSVLWYTINCIKVLFLPQVHSFPFKPITLDQFLQPRLCEHFQFLFLKLFSKPKAEAIQQNDFFVPLPGQLNPTGENHKILRKLPLYVKVLWAQ